MKDYFELKLAGFGRRSVRYCLVAAVAVGVSPLAGQTTASAVTTGRLAESGGNDWTQPLRRTGKPTAATLIKRLDAAPRRELVTVRESAGRPRVEVTRLGGSAMTRAAIDEALADPRVLSVSTPIPVTVQETGWSGLRGGSKPGPPRPVEPTAFKNAPAGASVTSPSPGWLAQGGQADPLWDRQWALATLDAERVWAQSARGVVVAVVDTGVSANHPDLAGVLTAGHDFVSGEDTTPATATDPYGHGTHVAGIIGAKAGNGIGGAGLAQGVRVMPVRVLDATGSGTDASVAKGVIWATDHGAKVINLSVGSPEYSAAEAAAVAYAVSRGVVVVAAAGNYQGSGNPTVYPAAFPGVIAVAAVDRSNQLAPFSSSGAAVDLAAPGVDIVSTYPPSDYSSIDGTSMASPFVAATAALVRAAAPKLGSKAVATLLGRTALDLSPAGRDAASGAGLVQPLAALAAVRWMPPPSAANTAGTTTLAPLGMPTTAHYGGSVTARFRLLSEGRGVPAQQVRVCRTVAPSGHRNCSVVVSDARGRVTLPLRATGTMRVWAEFPGKARLASASAEPLTIRVLPSLRLRGISGGMVLRLDPVGRGELVQVQRRTPSGWSVVTTRSVPASGVVTVRALSRGEVYRFAVAATSRTAAASSSALRVR